MPSDDDHLYGTYLSHPHLACDLDDAVADAMDNGVDSSGGDSVAAQNPGDMGNHPNQSPSSNPNMGHKPSHSPNHTKSSADNRTTMSMKVLTNHSTNCMTAQQPKHPSCQTSM